MAVVTVYSTEKMDELLDAGVVGASITDGELILELRDGSTISVGSILSDIPDAGTSIKGIVELATDAEALEGTDNIKSVTPFALKAVADTKQAADTDLTEIAALSKTNDSVLQVKGGVWSIRNLTQLSTDLGTVAIPDVLLHNGTSYARANANRIYIGPTDPGSVANGSIWYDTTGA